MEVMLIIAKYSEKKCILYAVTSESRSEAHFYLAYITYQLSLFQALFQTCIFRTYSLINIIF